MMVWTKGTMRWLPTLEFDEDKPFGPDKPFRFEDAEVFLDGVRVENVTFVDPELGRVMWWNPTTGLSYTKVGEVFMVFCTVRGEVASLPSVPFSQKYPGWEEDLNSFSPWVPGHLAKLHVKRMHQWVLEKAGKK